jgi:uncharacterized membrane protein YecN with MAPEG domain
MSDVDYNIQIYSSTAIVQSWAVIRKKKSTKEKFGDGGDAFLQAAPSYIFIYIQCNYNLIID